MVILVNACLGKDLRLSDVQICGIRNVRLDLAERERQNEEAGLSDMLKVALREQYAVESAEKNVDALQLYFHSLADFRAAVAQDDLSR